MRSVKRSVSARGWYRLGVFKQDGTEVSGKSRKVGNTITNIGARDCILAYKDNPFDNFAQWMVVGKGTNEITPSSTQLGSSFRSASASINSRSMVDNGDGTGTATCELSASYSIGEFDGDTLTEAGIADNSDSTDLYAGQLIKDENGDPTSVTVLSDEQLIIDYTIELTVPLEVEVISSGVTTVQGVDVDYKIYAYPYFDSPLDPTDTFGPTASFMDETSLQICTSTDAVLSGDHDLDWSGGGFSRSSDTELTVTSAFSAAPSDFSSSDIAYIVTGIDRDATHPSSGEYGSRNPIMAITFSPSLEKTSEEAFEMEWSLTYQVSL